MKKRLLTIFLSCCMITGMLAGCGKAESPSEEKTEATEVADEESGTETENKTEDAYNVGITYMTFGTDPVDLKKVEAAVSDYTMKKFGCTVTLKPVSITNAASQYRLWASSGENVDLLCLIGQNVGTLASDGMLIPLDDYMTEDITPNILRCAKERPFLCGGKYKGKQYAIPSIQPSEGEGKAMYVLKKYLDECDYEEKDIYTYEDLENLFAQMKKNHPDMVPWDKQGALIGSLSENFISEDNLGVAGALAGVLMDVGSDSTEVVNLFETEEYYDFLKFMHTCYQEGYISADAATSSDSESDWVISGRSMGFQVADDTPGNQEVTSATFGSETVQLNIKETYQVTSTYTLTNWGISSSCTNPELVLKVYDELFAKDGVFANLIQNGIEGEHYVTRENSKIIDFPEGVDASTSTFYNTLGVYGDKRNLYMYAPNEDSFYERSDEYTERAMSHQSVALGYTFDQTDYTSEIAAVSSVMSQYLASLEYGTVSDLDSYYEEFKKNLHAAGIDTLIQANQEQLDAFLEAQGE